MVSYEQLYFITSSEHIEKSKGEARQSLKDKEDIRNPHKKWFDLANHLLLSYEFCISRMKLNSFVLTSWKYGKIASDIFRNEWKYFVR